MRQAGGISRRIRTLPAQRDTSGPVSFLLMENFLASIARFCDSRKVHLFQADAQDTERACREYGEAILDSGPDLQVKGVGEGVLRNNIRPPDMALGCNRSHPGDIFLKN